MPARSAMLYVLGQVCAKSRITFVAKAEAVGAFSTRAGDTGSPARAGPPTGTTVLWVSSQVDTRRVLAAAALVGAHRALTFESVNAAAADHTAFTAVPIVAATAREKNK